MTRIDTRSAADLTSGVEALTRAVLADSIGRPERAARAGKAAAAARDLAQLARLLDPYADGCHSRAADTIAVQWPASVPGIDPTEAAERLACHRQAAELRAWTPLATLQGLVTGPETEVRPIVLPGAPLLEALARPAGPLRPGRDVAPLVTEWPAVTMNPVDGNELVPADFAVAGDPRRYAVAAVLVRVARQAADWAQGGLQAEALLTAAVLRALEAHLVGLLTSGLTPVAGIAAGETAVGTASGQAPDVVVYNGADLADVRTAYAGAPAALLPRFIASPAVTAGQAIVLASAGVDVEASGVEFMAEEDPRNFGRALAATAHGDARATIAGSVAVVTL